MYINHPLIKPGTVLKRDYQLEISKKLSHGKNTLVILPTGTGKTVIALLYIADLLTKNSNVKVIFIAPTKPLVKQHYEYIKSHLLISPLDIGLVTGERSPDARRQVWSKKIIIATPQSLYNDLIREYINPSEIKAIIFDEAHHAVGNHPYVKIVRYVYEHCSPQIIGLTASPGEEEKVTEIMKNLHLEELIVLTRTDEELRRYLPPINFLLVKTETDEIYRHAINLVYDTINHRISSLKELLSKYRDIITFSNWRDLTFSKLVELREKVEQIYSEGNLSLTTRNNVKSLIMELVILDKLATYLESYGFKPFIRYFEEILKRAAYKRRLVEKRIVSDLRLNEVYVLVKEMVDKNIIYPKFSVLKQILSKDDLGKVMIFVGLRETAFDLKEFLSSNGFSCGILVGQQRKGGMSQQMQILELSKFRSGTYNILIATQVGEEGLDIAECKTVIFYDNPVSSIRRIQRTGRTGRTMPGTIYFLINPNTRDEIRFWAGVKKERKHLRELRIMSYKISKVRNVVDDSKTLEKYMVLPAKEGEDMRLIKGEILVDHREKADLIFSVLKRAGYKVVITTLAIGDYVVGHYIIERKTFSDLAEALITGRIFDQLKGLSSTEYTPLIVIEGSETEFTGRISQTALRGLLLSIMLDFRIPVFITKNEDETAKLILHIADKALKEKSKKPPIRLERKPLSIAELQKYIVAGLPDVDTVLADRLLRKFKTIEKVFTASVDELMTIKGIGEKIAKKIREIITKEYTPD